MKKLLIGTLMMLSSTPTWAILYNYGYFDSKHHECRLTGWHGTQPTSGKLTLPSTYTHTDGITYDVVRIDNHALDGLTTVTELTIPASIDTIGEATSSRYPSELLNFRNCPALTKFKVTTGNPHFRATDDGLLYMKTGELLAVPQKLGVSGGKYTLPSVIKSVCSTAFAENTTIKYLTFNSDTQISANGGLNLAPNIVSYALTGSGRLELIDGVLADNSEGRVISYPRAGNTSSVSLPARIVTISDYAFYKAKAMTFIYLEGIRKIGCFGLAESGITSVSFPIVLKELEEGTLDNCASLKNISITAPTISLPQYFARNCKSLTAVTCGGVIDRIETGAFKGCSSLNSFPFSGQNKWTGDSVMYGCAFKEIVFRSSDVASSWTGGNTFSGNRYLTRIDASRLENTVKSPFSLWDNYASSCINLKTLVFPEFGSYSALTTASYIVPFGSSCEIERIEAHTLWNVREYSSGKKEQMFRFRYSTGSKRDYAPDMFIAVTANRRLSSAHYNEWGLKDMFQAGNGATVSPNVYVDASTPSVYYVDPIINYYIPGGCTRNYQEALIAGAKVNEMYQISIEKDNGKMKVTVKNPSGLVNGKPIDIYAVDFDNNIGKPDENGVVKSINYYDNISEVLVRYTLDGIKMETLYPREMWLQTGVEEEIVIPLGIVRNGRNIRFTGASSDLRYRIISIQGQVVMTGNETEIDTAGLAPGLYVVELLSGGSSHIEKILI